MIAVADSFDILVTVSGEWVVPRAWPTFLVMATVIVSLFGID
jgi:hypothetical protein